jgi:hypothetical protein
MHRLPWFCLWFEARGDRKLATLADDEHRVWFNLLCYAAEQPERGTILAPDLYLLAIEVAREDEELLIRTLGKLKKLRIIDDRDGERLTFPAFDKRNAGPVSPAERKQDQRRREAEALDVRGVTPDPNARDATADGVTPQRDAIPVASHRVTSRHEASPLQYSTVQDSTEENSTTTSPPTPPGGDAPDPGAARGGGRRIVEVAGDDAGRTGAAGGDVRRAGLAGLAGQAQPATGASGVRETGPKR